MLKAPLIPLTVLVGNPNAFSASSRLSCAHVERNPALCYGIGVERKDNEVVITSMCLHCAQLFAHKMHSVMVQCDYCGKFVSKDQMAQWMPLTGARIEGALPQLVCPHCARNSLSLQEDILYDITQFFKMEGKGVLHVCKN
jgi:hypothetical protein